MIARPWNLLEVDRANVDFDNALALAFAKSAENSLSKRPE
jgi:hypothetical protein